MVLGPQQLLSERLLWLPWFPTMRFRREYMPLQWFVTPLILLL